MPHSLTLCLRDSTEFSQCDIRVKEWLSFTVVSIELEPDGELWVWLPLSTRSTTDLGLLYAVNSDTFGMPDGAS